MFKKKIKNFCKKNDDLLNFEQFLFNISISFIKDDIL